MSVESRTEENKTTRSKVKDLSLDPPVHEIHASNAPGLSTTTDELENLRNVVDDQEKYIKVQELNQEIVKWRGRVINVANKSADVPAQAPLSRPESKLLKDWQNLAFGIRNLVANNFGSFREAKAVSWAKARGEWLREVTPAPVEVASGKKSGSALIEAAVWKALIRFVLGDVHTNGPMCWAGMYERGVYKLITRLQKDLAQMEPGGQSVALYYQWKALTTSIISTVQVPQDRKEEMNNSRLFHRELQAVVSKAIELDLKFPGQQAHYTAGWPTQGRCDVSLGQNLMKLAAGSPKSLRNALGCHLVG
ncbi:hypothetical protein B0J13DRAFT_678600 [Dactylonectria estremocensis]|uniref:Uncharacterized protein n=1 Tax=Dactylonectria estremocensis TaxID=1079267 RepID=A0A9P9E6C8_9HYPO|nr:hypothetical protein B0J13DRAFT_678600 [Dactylonectria estremocensis]